MTDWTLEIVKLVAQLFGALGISWLTVRWALGRYKSEKSWERETQALADILVALAQMERALNGMLNAHARDPGINTSGYSERYWTARSRLDEVGATASLLLEDAVHVTLDVLAAELDRPGEPGNWVADVAASIEAVSSARTDIVALATKRRRELMTTSAKRASSKFWGD